MISVTDIGNLLDELLGEGSFSETSPFEISAYDTHTKFLYACQLWKKKGEVYIEEQRQVDYVMINMNDYKLKRTKNGWKIDWRDLKPCQEVRKDKERELEETYDHIRNALVPQQREIGSPSTRLIEGN
ncbi:MAG: hypothetical protein Q7R76_06705 [Candidatus Woesearchaeota archaeon]|nr:hypothetical protein [Candidatus Woesearchaeota archaeon]